MPSLEGTVRTSQLHPYEQSIRDSEPLAYWRMNEVSGSTVEDLMGNYPGTLSGTLGYQRSNSGVDEDEVGLDFNGDEMFTDLPMSTLRTAGQWSMEAWLSHDNIGMGWSMALGASIQDCGGHAWWQLTKVSGSSNLRWETGDWLGNTSMDAAAGMGATPKHVVCRYNGTAKQIIVNGSVSASVSTGLNTTRNYGDFHVGAQRYSCGNAVREYWDGLIDSVAVFDRSLTDTEITERYNLGVGA